MNNLKRGFRLALLQIKVGSDKAKNLDKAVEKIRYAVNEKGAEVVALPECFNSPYGTQYFEDYSELVPAGETCQKLSEIAKELKIYLIGGTIPEKEENSTKLYNTCTIWNPDGSLQATYRKMHLFDIDIPGEITFKESDSLSAGNNLTIANVFGNKIGIGICYDIRFEELAKLYRKNGCDMLIYPGAFNMKTGPLHWELLARGRANDNQLFVATISPARDISAGYIAWGHSLAVDSWGKVLKSAEADEEVVDVDIDLSVNDTVRKNIPIFVQRRDDIYDTVEKYYRIYQKF